ncbi:hypothetical protein EIZ62_11870 [Streptomyces ficellus]|uniref:Uncharacterized protein n=1 Tax=Streptomyces ficellus TaxID=1977088 RepID=A0A6I6FSE9_9ACTN|nr:hypothetical protein EIZ62_11870 [Streptomyces ficellus]
MELLLEVTDNDQLTGAALDRVEADEFMPDEERTHARSAVREDEAEALAYLVEPVDLVGQVPGVELAQASWTSEQVDHDPDGDMWDLDEEDDEDHLDDVRP